MIVMVKTERPTCVSRFSPSVLVRSTISIEQSASAVTRMIDCHCTDVIRWRRLSRKEKRRCATTPPPNICTICIIERR